MQNVVLITCNCKTIVLVSLTVTPLRILNLIKATATTGYRGFNYLNYVKVNDTSGNLLFGANNTGDSGAGEIDVNVRSYFSDPDITLDGTVTQKLDKTGDGNLTFQHTQNNAADRTLLINATNAGGGDALINITAENDITISATHVDSRVNVRTTTSKTTFCPPPTLQWCWILMMMTT